VKSFLAITSKTSSGHRSVSTDMNSFLEMKFSAIISHFTQMLIKNSLVVNLFDTFHVNYQNF